LNAGLNDHKDAAATWNLIQAANTNKPFSSDAKTKATEIIGVALEYPIELDPTMKGGRQEDPKHWFYAQNFQAAKNSVAKENYALVTSVLWAANELYPNTKIIPVFDSYYVKGSDLTTTIVGDVNALTDELGIPPLSEFKTKPPARLGNQWNMLSTLHSNGLIDGWIGDIYGKEPNDPTNAEGKLPTPDSPFYSSNNPVPYALQSRSDYLDQKPTLPITSDFYDPKGIMPFNASIDFNNKLSVPVGYQGSSKLTPVVKSYPSTISVPIRSSESNHVMTPESIQTDDGFLQFTDADDTLMGQADIKFRLMGGDDYLEVVGGTNFANGNMGEDTIVLLAGIGEYLGGKEADIFEVFGSELGTLVNGNRGEDFITGFVNGVIYRGGKDDDTICCCQGEAWGDRGNDVFRGAKGGGYVVIQDYTMGEDSVELSMNGSWSKLESGLMFTDDTGDQIMLLVGITDIEQVTLA